VIERPATRADLPAVVALWRRHEVSTSGAAETDETAVREDWDRDGVDMARSTRVLEDPGAVVGYAVVGPDGNSDSVVDPARAGEGLEDRLLDWLEGAARESAPGDGAGHAVHHYWQADDADADARFARRGWHAARTYWRMRRELDGPTPEPVWPQGVRVRPFDLQRDAHPAHELVEDAFADVGDDRPRKDFATWAAGMLDPERFDADLYLVAEQQGEVVAVCLAQPMPAAGYVRQLAVRRAHRGRGLGLALLQESFRRHATRGWPATVLGVDAANATGATRLYERAGMRVVEAFTRWDLPLRP